MSDTENSVRIAARLTQLPTTISKAAQDHLALMCDMPRPPRPALDDIDGWNKTIAASDAMFAPRTDAMLAKAKSKVEERQIGGVRVYVATPPGMDKRAAERAYVYMHGGAFIFGGGRYPMAEAVDMADAMGVTVYSIDYRMAPAHRFPAAPNDCLAVYKDVVARHGANNVVVGGSSAGGNLALVTVLMARDQKLPLPAGLVLYTPETDLTETGDSFQTHENVDVVLKRHLLDCNELYAGGRDLKDPYLSPIFATYTKDFPPTWIQSGTRDLFLSNCAMLHRKMRNAGIDAELHVWEAMPHGGFGGASPEDADVDAAARAFIDRCFK